MDVLLMRYLVAMVVMMFSTQECNKDILNVDCNKATRQRTTLQFLFSLNIKDLKNTLAVDISSINFYKFLKMKVYFYCQKGIENLKIF